MSWEFIGISTGDIFIIDGVDIFKEEWESIDRTVNVLDPNYKQSFTFQIWKVKKKNKVITFAAGEFSNSVYGIYIRK